MSDQKDRSLAYRARRELVQFKLLPDSGVIGGVCAAIAYRLGIPTWLVRLLWVISVSLYGFGLGLYLVLWMFVPNATTPKDYGRRTGDSE